jgi:hypothetical protein
MNHFFNYSKLLGLIFCTLFSTSNLRSQTQYNNIRIPLGEYIGINTRPSDPENRIQAFNHVRSYHVWANDVGASPTANAVCPEDFEESSPDFMRYSYDPSKSGASANKISMSGFYGGLSRKVSPVLKDIAPIMRGLTYGACGELPFEQKPFCAPDFTFTPPTSIPAYQPPH